MLKLRGGPGNCQENCLRHILRKMRIHYHAQRRGVDEVDIPAHQRREGGLGAMLHIIAQQFLIVHVVHLF
jgi:hypothetical protein